MSSFGSENAGSLLRPSVGRLTVGLLGAGGVGGTTGGLVTLLFSLVDCWFWMLFAEAIFDRCHQYKINLAPADSNASIRMICISRVK